jgi:hypothetical protein
MCGCAADEHDVGKLTVPRLLGEDGWTLARPSAKTLKTCSIIMGEMLHEPTVAINREMSPSDGRTRRRLCHDQREDFCRALFLLTEASDTRR